jgi:hypothetical protein
MLAGATPEIGGCVCSAHLETGQQAWQEGLVWGEAPNESAHLREPTHGFASPAPRRIVLALICCVVGAVAGLRSALKPLVWKLGSGLHRAWSEGTAARHILLLVLLLLLLLLYRVREWCSLPLVQRR